MGEPFHGLSWGELFLFLSMPLIAWLADPDNWSSYPEGAGWNPYMGF